MATVEKYETESGIRYRVRYRKPNHAQTSKRGFLTKRDAQLFAASVEVSKAKGEFIDTSLGRVTIADAGENYLRTKKVSLRASTYRSVEGAWRLRVKERWGTTPLGAVQHEDVQVWIDQMRAQGYSTPTIMRTYGILLGILDRAVREKKIPAHSARGVELPKPKKSKRSYLTHAQVDVLARSAGEHATLIYTLAYTGIRWGEMAGLRAYSVDLERGRLSIFQSAVQIGSTFSLEAPKNGEPRSIPLPAFLVSRLRVHMAQMHPGDLVFGVAGEYPKRPHTSKGWLAWALKRAQAVDPTMPKVSPHELRHTAASLAVSAGANVKAVQRMLGHKSAAMTLDVYADLFDDDLESVATALDQARSDAVVSKMGPEVPADASSLTRDPSRELASRPIQPA